MTEEVPNGFLQDVKKFLQDIGVWDKLKGVAKDAAVGICAKVIPEKICQAVADTFL